MCQTQGSSWTMKSFGLGCLQSPQCDSAGWFTLVPRLPGDCFLKPQFRGRRIAEDLGVADVAGDGGNRAVSCLSHDVEGGGAVAGSLGREACPQRMPSKSPRIEAGPGDGALQDRAHRVRVQPGSPHPAVAVHLPEQRSRFAPGGFDPQPTCGARAGRRGRQAAPPPARSRPWAWRITRR